MNWMNFARVGKVVALLAFLMPWLVVSCQGTPMASATGLDLATGSMKALGGQSAPDSDPQLWAILALLLVIAGLVASFALKPVRRATMAVGGAAAAALLLCAVGMMLTISSGKEKLNQQQGGDAFSSGMQQAAAQAIRFETKLGYWLTLLGLAGAAGSAFMLYSGRPVPLAVTRLGDSLQTAAAGAGSSPNVGEPGMDADAAYWDAMADKTDPVALEEYVYRFPEGQFVGLAKERLARPAASGAQNS